MKPSIRDVVNLYNPYDPLEEAWTIPAPWYFDDRIAELERASVFSATWQVVGRTDQVRENEQSFTASWRANLLSSHAETMASYALPQRLPTPRRRRRH